MQNVGGEGKSISIGIPNLKQLKPASGKKGGPPVIAEKNHMRRLGNQVFFTGPTVLVFTAVIVIPFLYGIYLTFFAWDGVSSTMPFVGGSNYVEVMQDSKFWSSVWLTVKYVLATVILINGVAFLLAYLVTNGIKGENFFSRSLLYA